MQRLINDLLAFSRIGRLTAGFTDVDLDRVLAEVRSQLEARAGDDAEISWADLPTVEGEEPLLTTLFVNLVGNSLKFRRPDVPPVITGHAPSGTATSGGSTSGTTASASRPSSPTRSS